MSLIKQLNEQTVNVSETYTFADAVKDQPDEMKKELYEFLKRLFKKQGKSIGIQSLGIQYLRDYMDEVKPNPRSLLITVRKLLDVDEVITPKTTGMSYYDDMMDDPDYFKNNKGRYFKIVNMDPAAYLRACEQGFRASGETFDSFTPEKHLVQKYAEKMVNGTKFPLLTLKYTMGKDGDLADFSQEGRHRAHAAIYIGAHNVKVIVVTDIVHIDDKDSDKYKRFRDKRL